MQLRRALPITLTRHAALCALVKALDISAAEAHAAAKAGFCACAGAVLGAGVAVLITVSIADAITTLGCRAAVYGAVGRALMTCTGRAAERHKFIVYPGTWPDILNALDPDDLTM